MIKLISYRNNEKGKIVFINKSCIGGMVRDEQKGLTCVWDNGVTESASYEFKETPEEILAMPDIEEGNKVIDWEQRRYEIIKLILPKLPQYGELKVSAQSVVRFTNVLIEELKKGGKNEKENFT